MNTNEYNGKFVYCVHAVCETALETVNTNNAETLICIAGMEAEKQISTQLRKFHEQTFGKNKNSETALKSVRKFCLH